MRVLYLNPFSQQISGPDESLLALLEALIPLGVEAHLVLPAPGPQVSRYEKLGVKVHIAPISALKRSLRPRDLARYGARLTRGAIEVARIARRERIELIHTNMEVVLDGALAAKLLRIPHVMHYRGNTIDEPKRVFDALVALWTAGADHIFCISNATAEVFRKRGKGAKVETLYNPVPLERFRHAKREAHVREALGAKDDELLIGTVGRIHPRKDIETFVRAAAIVAKDQPRARFVVVGMAEVPEELEYERRVRAIAKELGLDGKLTWAGARRDMPEVLKALDVFVLCSRHEGFGRVVAEAMATGVPVVATDEGALPELLDEGRAGLTAPPTDARRFAVQISVALSVANGLSESARVRSAQFDPPALAAAVIAQYRDALQARNRGE